MPFFKVNYFFKLDEAGWSETFYTPDLADAGVALDRARTLVVPRVRLLANDHLASINPRLAEVRVSDVAIQRDSLVFTVSPTDGVNATPVIDDAVLPIFNSLLIRLEAGSLYRRQLYLRGIPKQLSGPGGIYRPNPLYNAVFGQYVLAVLASGFGILAWQKPGVFVPLQNIVNVTNGVDGVTINAPAHGLINQDRLRVQSAPGTHGVRGNWVAKVIDVNNFVLIGAPAFTGTYLGGGKWYKRVQGVVAFTSMLIESLVHRDTGRPFDSPRGRRKRPARA